MKNKPEKFDDLSLEQKIIMLFAYARDKKGFTKHEAITVIHQIKNIINTNKVRRLLNRELLVDIKNTEIFFRDFVTKEILQ